jgi:DNA uptake protein ComE-like DNA-binding protein/endonuclease YncB( thermonuclease family)
MKRRSGISLVRWAAVLLLLAAPVATCFARGPWVSLPNCRYLLKRANDGDSFHVSVNGKEYIFRLYFVDTPETDTEFRDRVEEQAKYFGLTVAETVKLGELAKVYTREKLSGPFVVRTCWEDAMGRSRLPRFYALVQTNNGDLGEQLVENGLARIHGKRAAPEGITTARQEWQRLTRLERKARQEKVGGWGNSEGRIAARAEAPESAQGTDPFDAFFHPPNTQRNRATSGTVTNAWPFSTPGAAPAPTGVAAPPAQTPSGTKASPVTARASSESGTQRRETAAQQIGKLDINAASQAELENLPGVGPVLAQRIIAARPFKSADDLRSVKGIGDKRYAQLRPYFQ